MATRIKKDPTDEMVADDLIKLTSKIQGLSPADAEFLLKVAEHVRITRYRERNEWDRGYRACKRGDQPHNPHLEYYSREDES
jgi:hypothetical protein